MPWTEEVKIITWNVNGIRAVAQKGLWDFIRREQPDVLCLQETKAHPDQLDRELVEPAGWTSGWSASSRPGYSGVATFSRTRPLEMGPGFGVRKFDAEGRVLVSKFPGFTLYNAYFPNGGSGPERHEFKQEFLRRFGTHVQRQAEAGESVIVVGDYNVAYLDIDVFDPKSLAEESGFLPEERAWMREFLDRGFVDAFRHLHPRALHRYTWWSYQLNARAGNRGWRIDHICVSRDLAPRLRSAEILDSVTGSDHCPVVVELEMEG